MRLYVDRKTRELAMRSEGAISFDALKFEEVVVEPTQAEIDKMRRNVPARVGADGKRAFEDEKFPKLKE